MQSAWCRADCLPGSRAVPASPCHNGGNQSAHSIPRRPIIVVLGAIFRADIFPPWAQPATIGYARRPGHGEGIVILYGETDFQSFAPIIQVNDRSRITATWQLKVLFCVAV